jgi:protein TonB
MIKLTIIFLCAAFLPIYYEPAIAQSVNSKEVRSAEQRIRALELKQAELMRDIIEQSRNLRPEKRAEIEEQISKLEKSNANNKRFKRYISGEKAITFMAGDTDDVSAAIYTKLVSKKIEDVGTCSFPKKNGKKLYGKLLVSIPISEDGSIYTKNGGIRVEKSSGNKDLDNFAIKTVSQVAPFDPIPEELKVKGKDNLFIIISTFDFTHDASIRPDVEDTDCSSVKKIK